MVLGSVDCPAEVRCATVFALQNGKFSSRLGGYSPPYPLRFVLGSMQGRNFTKTLGGFRDCPAKLLACDLFRLVTVVH